jgi:Zn-finger nucleic acid-binding protein
MKQDVAGDITTEVCPKCGGVFLDKGELNILATGIKGDIELCSIDNDFHEDRFQQRSCPKCDAQQMAKVNLLRLSDLIFDYCWKCEGFFLDMGEIQAMNRELKSLTPNKSAEEYRATHSNHLVRIDQTTDVADSGFAGVSRLAFAGYIRVSVFFSKEMPPSIRVFQEVWPMRLAKGLGLFWGQDIKTEDEQFDAIFRVQGQDAKAIARHLDDEARKLLLQFATGRRSIYSLTGSLEITSSGVVYIEGPYTPHGMDDIVERSMPLINELVEIAGKIEVVP